jgi:hypothetical protein
MKILNNFLLNDKGQSIVETALVLPLIVLILTGIIDFGFLFSNYLQISNAARDAARSAAIGMLDSDINVLITNMTPTLVPEDRTVTITPPEGSRVKGEEVKVSISYDYHLLTPVISSIVPNPITLNADTSMRME